jgi:RNA polymerase sigma factor (sigma-70 family)
MVTNSLFRHLGSPESDRELLARYITFRDEDAFAALVDRHGPLVRGICLRMLRDPHLADDAFQATFLLLARKARTLVNADAVGSWLFGVARRVSFAALRSKRRMVSLPPDVEPPATEDNHDWDELLAILEAELANLPADLRAPLIACFLQGKTQDEAARALGWSLSTLRRRLDEGRELLRARLKSRGASLPAGLFVGALIPHVQSAVPATLRATLLVLVAGGPVPASVAALLAAFNGSSWALNSFFLIAGLTLVARLAYGATLLVAPAPPPPSPPPLLPGAQAQANPWEEPLPRNALTRLGTTAFRHGTDGPAGSLNPQGVHQVMFQGDGTLVSAGGEQVRFWNATTGEELHRAAPAISTHLHNLRNAQLFDAGARFLLPDADEQGNERPSITLWDLHARRSLGRIHLRKHPGWKLTCVGPGTVAAGGTAYAQLDSDGNIWTWNADGSPRTRLDGIFRPADVLTLLPDGKTALTVEDRQRVRLWDTNTGQAFRTFGGDLRPAMTAVVSPDGTWLATLGEREMFAPEAFLRMWSVAEGKLVAELPWPGLPARLSMPARLGFSADGTVLVGIAAGGDWQIHFCRWTVPDGASFSWSAPIRGVPPSGLAVDARHHRVAITGTGSDGILRMFDSSTGRELSPADAHSGAIQSVSFAPDGRSVLSMDVTHELRTWDMTGRLLSAVQAQTATAPSPTVLINANSIVVHPRKPEERKLDLSVYELLKSRPAYESVLPPNLSDKHPQLILKTAELSPDGQTLAVGFATLPPVPGELGRVAVFDLNKGQLKWSMRTAECAPATLRFSPDGQRLAVGTTRVLLMDTRTGEQKAVFTGHRGAVTALSFRPDGRLLASGSTDSTILVWDCPP